jgi:hypothetical protein
MVPSSGQKRPFPRSEFNEVSMGDFDGSRARAAGEAQAGDRDGCGSRAGESGLE